MNINIIHKRQANNNRTGISALLPVQVESASVLINSCAQSFAISSEKQCGVQDFWPARILGGFPDNNASGGPTFCFMSV
eukprot:scaffold331882_cov29-Prasinocladus_malaysianus.AAC.1